MLLAIVTPSLVIVGVAIAFAISKTTFRPFGPIVVLTVSANLSAPLGRRSVHLQET